MDAVNAANLAVNSKRAATYPPDHKPAMKVPEGGSNCAKCKFVAADLKHCGNPYYRKYYGTDKLPYPADQFCSDWFEAR